MTKSPSSDAGQARAQFAADFGDDDFADLLATTLFHKDGKLHARFHDQGVKPNFDLEFMASVGNSVVARALSEAFVVAASTRKSYDGRYTFYKTLKYGFATFLTSAPLVSFDDLNSGKIDAFDEWLQQRYPTNRRQRTTAMAVVTNIIAALRLMPDWQGAIREEIHFPPKRKDRRSPTKTTNVTISEADYEKLWLAASRTSRRLVSLHEKRMKGLEAWKGRTATLSDLKAEPLALAAYMAEKYPDRIPPSFNAVRGRYPARRLGPRRWQRARSILMPYIAEFVPSILILTIIFALNPSTVQRFRFALDYSREEVLGRERLFIRPIKQRARGKKQRNSIICTEDGDNPSKIIQYLEERTAFLRERATSPHASLLFLWLNRNKEASFAGSDFSFRQALSKFAKRHGLTGLQLKQIRPMTLDTLHKITGGNLLEVKAHANHESIQTTFTDYRTDPIARRDDEQLGRAMMENERYLATGGIVRPFLVAPNLDKGSATPGYACLDPTDSPIPGQAKGKLCTAYGRCPICPLAMVQTTPEAYAYLLRLLERIDEALAAGIVAAPEWLGRWAIVKKSVLIHLAMFDDETVIAGLHANIPLPPPIE